MSDPQALCTYIGDKGADLQSHAAVGSEFANAIWENAVPFVWTKDLPVDSKSLKATDLVFRALIGENKMDEWAKWAGTFFLTLDERPGRYLLRWCEEKFLPVDQIRRILGDEIH